MSRHMHLCLDIRGAIQGTGWKCVSRGGKTVKKAEAIEYLMDRLAEGKRVLPVGPCEGFSFQTGCPGHDDEPARCESCGEADPTVKHRERTGGPDGMLCDSCEHDVDLNGREPRQF